MHPRMTSAMLPPAQTPTEQELLWAGEFGDEWLLRNQGDAGVSRTRVDLFRKILPGPLESVLEAGAGAGDNLDALRELLPAARFSGYDVNEKAVETMRAKGYEAYRSSIIGPSISKAEMVLTYGVLMVLPETDSVAAYKNLFDSADRYICLCEYYSPRYEEIPYRNGERLFRADHAGTMMDMFPLALLNYGFLYRRDPAAPTRDLTWFLLEKRPNSSPE